jgi:hypothetical protein
MLQYALLVLVLFQPVGRLGIAAPVSVPSSNLAVSDGSYAAWAALYPNPLVSHCVQ